MNFQNGKREMYENKVKLDNVQGKRSARKILKGNLIFLIVCLIFALIIRMYFLERADVDGISMYPTLKDKDVVFVEKISDSIKSFTKGEIIIFNPPNDMASIYIKRIIAMGGDKLEIKNGQVFVNGKQTEEKYLPKEAQTSYGSFITDDYIYTVPKDSVFVMGDNRERSNDSRNFGPVPVKNIKGHAFLRVKPFDQFTVL